MAFKPQKTQSTNTEYVQREIPVPREGSRKARVSLIVDMGVQEREDFVDEETGETKPQKPCQQVAVFADLVVDRVDYGGEIGTKQYRMLLNKEFKGDIVGINFTTTPPKDAKGKLIEGKPWGLHPANLLTKLAKVTGNEDIVVEDRDSERSLDISLLLNEPFMCQVEVKKTPAKDKKDAEGNPVVYTNVNYKGCAPVPEDDDGNPLPVADLDAEPLCITFDNAKKEDIKFIRPRLLKQVKKANNYVGSAMQRAVEAFEAEREAAKEAAEEQEEKKPAGKPAASKPAAKPTGKPAKKPAPAEEPEDEDVPF